MNTELFPIRLREARKMMGLSMDKLVERTGNVITKQSISRYEKGVMRPKRDALNALAEALSISEGYFYGESLKLDFPMLRDTSGKQVPTDVLLSMEARLACWAEQLFAKEKASHCHTKFCAPLSDVCVSTLSDVIRAAELLRERWHCGDGPIPSVLRLLERKGIRILSSHLPDHVYGLSTWADGIHPLIVLDMRSDKTTPERLRFTAGHELAHLLLEIPENPVYPKEKLCNMFSCFFLFPRNTFIEEMGGEKRSIITLNELIDLKGIYGVSVAAQVHEAWDIQMISREHYDWWYEEMIKKNMREEGWGQYVFPETLGRESRIDSIIIGMDKDGYVDSRRPEGKEIVE